MKFPRSRRPRRPLLVPAALAALAALAPAALAAVPSDLPRPGQGLNLLVVGIDSRKGVTAEEKERFRLGGKECDCTDVMMLVHVSAENDRVDVVSLPVTRSPPSPTSTATGAPESSTRPTRRRSTAPGRRAVPPSPWRPSNR